MKMPRTVGFFSELRHGFPEAGSLRQSVSDTPSPNEDLVVRYLDQGIRWCICLGGDCHDVLDPENKVIEAVPPRFLARGPVILTDGEWVWPGDLSYYVQTYHARLPDEFISHMRDSNWRVPEEDSVDLSQLSMTALHAIPGDQQPPE
jgi:hypothetical protein